MEQTGQWQRVKELFDQALGHNADDRDAFLSRACGADSSLRAEVDSLLSAYARSDGLSQPLLSVDETPEAEPDQLIGAYRLIRKIGEGGMGQVWLAEQAEPLRRQVALKLLRTGLASESLLRRFAAERQSLALMEHPTIAKVFDAGATAGGQPYLVMEYVAGEPITSYCDRKRLGIRDRLVLFAKVCDGVQHAHQKAILHRDLKPANILVVEIDREAQPRIIDFGLAQVLEPGAESKLPDAPELMAGTPGYMSPEQARGGDIDSRTDVYSLGVVLYELLTGQLSVDARHLAHEVSSDQEERVVRPSVRIAENSDSAREAAEQRSASQRRLARQIAGDLDLIVLKAIEKDRALRYGTPAEIAADTRRYLRHDPVDAHPANAGYQVRKFIRRHRVGTAMTLLLALLMVAFTVVQAMELRRIARERDREERIAEFMTGMFKVSDPGQSHGNTVTAREILDKASTQIESGLARDPDTQTRMMMVMGAVYENLGIYDRAESLYREATDIRKRQLGPENSDTLKSEASLAWTLYRRGRYRDAETMLRQILAVRLRRSGANNADTIDVMDYLGAVLNEEGRASEAESLDRQVLAWRRRVLGDGSPETAVAMNHLALALQSQGRWSEAEAMDRSQIALWRQIEGADSPRGLSAADNLAIILYRELRLPDAEALVRQTLAAKQRVLGPDHPETVRSMNTLTAILTDEGKLPEAQVLAEQVVALRARVLGPDHPLTLSATSNLAEILTRRGNYGRARELLEKTRASEIRVMGLDNPTTANATYNLACLELRLGRRDDALQLLQQAIDHGLAGYIVTAMPKDPDLAALRGDPRFAALVKHANNEASTAAKKQ